MATVIFKPTEACNARCVYCDVVHKDNHTSKRMPLDTLEKFFSRIDEFLRERPNETMDVIWHGGEPLLLGPDYFAKALFFQEKHCAETSGRIRHSIQSNLTLLTQELAAILKKLGIDSIGTSYDPIENVRGLGKRRDSRAYNRKFMEGIRLLEEEGINWGIIYVVTKLSLAKPVEIFQFLSNLSPKGAFMFNPVLVYTREYEHIAVSAEEYADFLGAILPHWWRRRDELSNIEPFTSLVTNLRGEGTSLMCSDSGACAYQHINVVADGSLSHCGRSADWGLLNYGSIFDRTFAQALADPQRDEFVRRNEVLPATECKGCRFWTICHGGCPLDAWSSAGSFLHKSEWCYAKRGFIEKYLEPILSSGSNNSILSLPPGEMSAGAVCAPNPPASPTPDFPIVPGDDMHGRWINPIGGLGDSLMISGVLKLFSERYPAQKLNLVERTKYRHILEGHPAIDRIGNPPDGAAFVSTNYWDHDDYRLRGKRAYQVLARIFGVDPPVEERLYVPWEIRDDAQLMSIVPWKQCNVLICQSSDSPRKEMRTKVWESLVASLIARGLGVVQAGRMGDCYVRGAYSLLGLTTPRQIISLLRHFDVIVTVDNFIMHAAHLCGVRAVVLWGPTDHRVYGYAGQTHLQAQLQCDFPGGCIGPDQGAVYQSVCSNDSSHCMNSLRLDAIVDAVMRGLGTKDGAAVTGPVLSAKHIRASVM